MDKINQLIQTDIDKLNQIIREDLVSKIPLIQTIGEYIISAGGKRIRPVITILCGRLLGYNEQALYKIAAMIEYIHTATLLHDDVVDESGLRRGRKTSNAIFGNAASVLVGDFIYTRAFQMMVSTNSLDILRVMANSTNIISEGEVLQLLNIGRSDLTEAEYFQVIESKTAKLFEASARVAAILANADSFHEQKLANYAIYLGTAFQIIDDILDYQSTAEITGKNIGDDLIEGKVTLPIIYLLKNATLEEQKFLRYAIDSPKNADIGQVIKMLKNSQALQYCYDSASKYVNMAINELAEFADNSYKSALINLVKSSLIRIS